MTERDLQNVLVDPSLTPETFLGSLRSLSSALASKVDSRGFIDVQISETEKKRALRKPAAVVANELQQVREKQSRLKLRIAAVHLTLLL